MQILIVGLANPAWIPGTGTVTHLSQQPDQELTLEADGILYEKGETLVLIPWQNVTHVAYVRPKKGKK